MKVVVTSDQHLGSATADKEAFNAFLDGLRDDCSLTHFVLLGDVVDMWRRDASGVFLENHDTISKILALQSRGVKVYYLAGNHDYHVLNLQLPSYPFRFLKELEIPDGQITYRFVHGHSYDPEQKEHIIALLCRIMSDNLGTYENNLWTNLNHFEEVLRKYPVIGSKSEVREVVDRLRRRPEERLQSSIDKINATACADVKPNQVLVFGHTHAPFINKAENVVNSGSWVKDAKIHNTYVVISDGKPRLYIFGGKVEEITERATF